MNSKNRIYQQHIEELTSKKRKPLSAKFLLDRGSCCGNGCRHCPYKQQACKK